MLHRVPDFDRSFGTAKIGYVANTIGEWQTSVSTNCGNKPSDYIEAAGHFLTS
jgi:hypothetical protein